jgi:vesicle coat complex subunit
MLNVLQKCATDNSPYVRKTAAHSVGKIFQIDPDAKGELVEVIERLLGDKASRMTLKPCAIQFQRLLSCR